MHIFFLVVLSGMCYITRDWSSMCKYGDNQINCFSWQLSLTTGEEVEIEDEVDGWFYVSLWGDISLYLV